MEQDYLPSVYNLFLLFLYLPHRFVKSEAVVVVLNCTMFVMIIIHSLSVFTESVFLGTVFECGLIHKTYT